VSHAMSAPPGGPVIHRHVHIQALTMISVRRGSGVLTSVTEEHYNSETLTFRIHIWPLSSGSRIKLKKKFSFVSCFRWLVSYLTPSKRRHVPEQHGLAALRKDTSNPTNVERAFLLQDWPHNALRTCTVSQTDRQT
jgi:hypothetical protein